MHARFFMAIKSARMGHAAWFLAVVNASLLDDVVAGLPKEAVVKT